MFSLYQSSIYVEKRIIFSCLESKSTFPSLEKPKRQDQFVESKITDRDDKDVTSTKKSLKISEASKREHQLSDGLYLISHY